MVYGHGIIISKFKIHTQLYVSISNCVCYKRVPTNIVVLGGPNTMGMIHLSLWCIYKSGEMNSKDSEHAIFTVKERGNYVCSTNKAFQTFSHMGTKYIWYASNVSYFYA